MVFSYTDAEFLDKNIVKVIHGVAGRGKSSVINSFMQANGIEYLWTTSTNKLKRDAEARFNCKASTVCSALFENKNGCFYISEKDPDCDTIIIDEILQTSHKVLTWIENHVGRYNIIVMTDMKQMLTIDNSIMHKTFLKQFEDFIAQPYVKADEGTTTQRARDKKTKDKIEYLYTKSGEAADAFKRDMNACSFPVIPYEAMDFNLNDIFITHLNETEDYLYRDKKLSMLPLSYDDVIPKGGIANKPPKDLSRYPVLSQLQAERLKSQAYCQLKNVGSCTRYQGSECTDTQKLYYIITEDSTITNREWYTVVSRCWTIDSIVIVIAQKEKRENLTTFNGKKIKEAKTLALLSADVSDRIRGKL